MKKIMFLLIALLLIGMVAGCSTSNTQTFKDKDGEGEVKVDKDKGSFKYKNDKSEGSAEVGEDVKLPKDFPKDLPIYDDSKLTFASSTKSNDVQIIVTTHETKDGISKVNDFFSKKLEEKGYSIENTFETGNAITQTALKGDERVIVAVTEKDGKTTIMTNVTIENK